MITLPPHTIARAPSRASRFARTIRNFFLTLHPHTSGRAPPDRTARRARQLSLRLLASRLTRTVRNLFLTPRPHTPGALRFARRARQHFLTALPFLLPRARQHSLPSLPFLRPLTSLPLFLLFFLIPSSAFAQANPTIGGGGGCTGWVASDTTTQGAQLAENDGLYTCQSSAWVPETLVVGSVLQNGAAPTCSSATAGMLYYTGGTVEFCNGSAFTSFAAGASVALSAITAAVGTNTILSGTNAQVWDWALTGQTGFTFGESAASTGASKLVAITTAGGSTAIPLTITNGATSTNPVSINMTLGGIAVNGTNILLNPDADGTSIAVGGVALTNQNATSLYNAAVGYEAGRYISSGTYNVAIGPIVMAGVSATPLTGSAPLQLRKRAPGFPPPRRWQSTVPAPAPLRRQARRLFMRAPMEP
jgi:hypothetical protein